MLERALQHVDKPCYRALIAFETFRHARAWVDNNVAPLCQELKAEFNVAQMQMRFPSGAKLVISSFANKDDIYKHTGCEYDDVFVMGPLERETIEFLNTRTCRRSTT